MKRLFHISLVAAACAALALLLTAPMVFAAELPTAVGQSGVAREAGPAAIIVPEDPGDPDGPGCVVGTTGCSLSVTPSLPTGAATAANQTTLNGYVDGVEGLLAAATPAGENHIGAVGGHTVNPTSSQTRPADASPYAQNDLIASSTTAGSIVVPSVTVMRTAAGSGLALRFRLYTSKTSGWDAVNLRIRFWTAAPTYANGDNGAYSVSTGAAGYLGKAEVTLEQFGDGAAGIATPYTGSAMGLKLASGQVIYWDLQYIGSASLTPASAQTFTLVPEFVQD